VVAKLVIGQTFQAYDFGAAENQARYGQSTPLVYDLTKVTCPVYIFWGANDKASAPAVNNPILRIPGVYFIYLIQHYKFRMWRGWRIEWAI